MNRNGRIVGGTLVGLALLWLLRIIGALPFSDRSVNQAAAQVPQDRPAIADFNASRSQTAALNPPTTTQPFLPDGSTSGDGSSSNSGASQPGTGTAPDTTPINPTTRLPATPIVRGAW